MPTLNTLPPIRWGGQQPLTNTPESLGPDCHPTYQAVNAWGALPNYELFMCKLTQGDHEINGAVVYASNAYALLGLKWRYFGMYHWLEHDVPIDVQLKAFQFAILKVLKQLGTTLAVAFPQGVIWMLDWERTENHPDPTCIMAEQFIAGMEAWVKERGINYAADWLPDFVAWRVRNPDYPLWYANYNLSRTDPRGAIAKCALYRATMSQWSNHAAQPIGFRNVGNAMDMNACLNFDTLNRIAGIPHPIPPTPDLTPDPTPQPPHSGDNDMAGYTNLEVHPDPAGQTGQPGQNADGTWPPGFIQWASVFDNVKWTKYHMGATEYDGRVTVGKNNAQLAAIPDYAGMQVAPIRLQGSITGNVEGGSV